MPNSATSYDYSPFGMAMPGRQFNSPDYKYGFNGQEKDDEITGNAGTHTGALFWEYDSRTGRRWNLDPKPIMPSSDYVCFLNNPIWFNDVLGDILDIGSNQASKNDIVSIVSEANQKYLTIVDNRVGLDFGCLEQIEIDKILNADEGLKLVNDLVESDKKFLYEASDVILGRDEEGNKAAGLTYMDPNNVVNASEYGKDSEGKHTRRPKEGYEGQVIIHPDAQFEEFDGVGNMVKKSRSSIVFHELEESYQRTHFKKDYKGANGAHNLAIIREGKWSGSSRKPGVVSRVIPGKKPTAERRKEIQELVKGYYGYTE